MSYLFDLADPYVLSVAGRQLPFPQGVFWQWLPEASQNSRYYKFTTYDNSFGSAAPIRPADTPAVPMDRPGESEVIGKLPAYGVVHWLTEDEKDFLDSLSSNDPDNTRVQQVFARALKRLSDSIRQSIMLQQGELVSNGTITLGTQAQPNNRVQGGVIDFGIPAQNKFAASKDWDDTSGGGPGILGQILDWKQLYVDNTGNAVEPGVLVVSTRVLNIMLKDAEVRTLAGTILGAPTSVGIGTLNSILSERSLPRLIVSDAKTKDYTGTLTREFPDNKVVMLPEVGTPVGETQWGVTQEARTLAKAQAIPEERMPGLVAIPREEEDPVRTGLQVAAVAMPVLTQPDLVMSVTVVD